MVTVTGKGDNPSYGYHPSHSPSKKMGIVWDPGILKQPMLEASRCVPRENVGIYVVIRCGYVMINVCI